MAGLESYSCPLKIALVTREQIRSAGVAAGTDKVVHHAYERFYANFLGDFDGNGVIVEIGYGKGESIAFWKSLFPSAFLYVIDRDVELEGDGFAVLKCDQSSTSQLVQLRDFLQGRDVAVILDDGSHIPEHQLETFNSLFGVLRQGGIYVFEDIECSYWRYGDCYGYPTRYGLKSCRSLMSKLMLLSHWINREFFAHREKRGFARLLRRQGFNMEALEGVASVAFAHNCVAVSKCLDGDEIYAARDYGFAGCVQPSVRSVVESYAPRLVSDLLRRSYKSLRELIFRG